MREKIAGAAFLLLLLLFAIAKFLGPPTRVPVRGYTKQDGTQVAPHSRRK